MNTGYYTSGSMKESTARERAFEIKVREVDKSFSDALGKINNLERIFRDNGDLEKAIVDINGDIAWLEDVRDALANAWEALENANYGVLGHIEEKQ